MHNHYTTNLLGLEGVKITKVLEDNNYDKHIHIKTLKPKDMVCPNCYSTHFVVHDYLHSTAKHTPFGFQKVYLHITKCRRECKGCGTRIIDNLSFLGKRKRITRPLIYNIVLSLKEVDSSVAVAKRHNVSATFVRTHLPMLSGGSNVLPYALCIDEFKGNSGGQKYHVALVDFETSKVIDVIEHRNINKLKTYLKKRFKNFDDVQYFISDMYKPYIQLAHELFKKATIVIDRFHYTRYVVWAFQNTRKASQKEMCKANRLAYKANIRVLTMRYNNIKDEETRMHVNVLLSYNDELRQAHFMKEWFYKINDSNDPEYKKKEFAQWVQVAFDSGNEFFKSAAQTLSNWSKYIVNSFDVNCSNGPMEGVNNKIKVIKRNAYGFQNFETHRKKILCVLG